MPLIIYLVYGHEKKIDFKRLDNKNKLKLHENE